MSGHTPGAWVVGRSPEFDAFEFDVKAGEFYVAAIPDVPGCTEANAHLIAAAPDLYAVVKALLSEDVGDIGHEFERAEAAVKKAEGRT